MSCLHVPWTSCHVVLCVIKACTRAQSREKASAASAPRGPRTQTGALGSTRKVAFDQFQLYQTRRAETLLFVISLSDFMRQLSQSARSPRLLNDCTQRASEECSGITEQRLQCFI